MYPKSRFRVHVPKTWVRIMEIKTKYNIGDTRWMMHDNKAIVAMIKSIAVTAEEGSLSVAYYLRGNGYELGCFNDREVESKTFATKQELLNSL